MSRCNWRRRKYWPPPSIPPCSDSGEQILPLLAEVSLEAIILDLETAHASDDQMLRLVRQLRERDENLVLLGFTRSHNKTSRRQFEQAGIGHCFVAPVDFEEVQAVLRSALEERSAEIENRKMREEARERNSFCQLIGGSEPMRLVYDAISRVAESTSTCWCAGRAGPAKSWWRRPSWPADRGKTSLSSA